MIDIECQIERHIDKAVQASRTADHNIRRAGWHVYHVWRTYQYNAVVDVAQRADRSERTIRNWAHFWDMFYRLRESRKSASELKRMFALPPTVMWTGWEKQRQYGYETPKAAEYFETLLQYKDNGESASAQTLSREIDAHEDKSGRVPTWNYYAPRTHSLYVSLVACQDTPADVRAWLADAPDSVRLVEMEAK